MAFVDEVRIHVQAGHGGSGVVRWLHSKETARGGPCGGDGGRGGDVIVEGVRDLAVLSTYRYTKKFRAENGVSGQSTNKHGSDGAHIILKVPIGSVVKIFGSGESHELIHEGQQIVIFKGGAGGYGNAHFKSSTNQNPFQKTDGKKGGGGDIEITLKLIADAGLIGFPNAGKSSLLNALTRAQSKIGAYPFTTLEPHLGDFYGYILADIPGLIEGASGGKGLGSKFLRHIERTGLLIHLVSSEQEDPAASYTAIRSELSLFGRELTAKQELIVLTKTDLLLPEEVAEKLEALKKVRGTAEVLTVSVEDPESLKAFSDTLSSLLKKNISR